MPVTRIHWDDLPLAARAAVEQHTGSILSAETTVGGVNSGIAVIVRTAHSVLFVKGVPADHPQVRTQQREAEINPYLPAACPRLLWHVREGGWDLIGYERIVGRHANYSPGSPDLPLVARALAELQNTPCPDIELKRAEDRWSGYAGPAGCRAAHRRRAAAHRPRAAQLAHHDARAPHRLGMANPRRRMDRPCGAHPATYGSRALSRLGRRVGTRSVPHVGNGRRRVRAGFLRGERPHVGRDRAQRSPGVEEEHVPPGPRLAELLAARQVRPH